MALVAAGARPAPDSGAVTQPPETFDRRAQALVAGRPHPNAPLAAGAVQLLGMWDIRAELGAAWEAVAAEAYRVTERVIRSHLTDADLYERKDEETYILCFSALDLEQAEQKTRTIVAEVKAVLLRDVPQASKLRLGYQVMKLDPENVLKSSGSLLEAVAASLDAVKQEAAEVFERQRRMLIKDATVVFSPCWNPARQSVVLYRCLLDDWTSQTTLQNLKTLSDAESLQQAIADLDYLILGRAIQTLHSILQSDGKAVLLVPVHFQTLSERARREEYLSLCRRMPKPYGKFVILEIYGVPSQAPTSRILEVVNAVRPYCNTLVVSVPVTEDRSLHELGLMGIYGVAAALEELPEGSFGALAKYAAAAKAAKLRSFMHGARTIGLAKMAVEAGFDYIDGETIAPKTDMPKGAYRCNPLEP